MNTFTEKVAIVTGATSGMGKAIAQLFAQEGAKLVLSGRDPAKGDPLLAELTDAGTEVVIHYGDVAAPETNKQLVALAQEQFGRLDIVSTNAGILGLGSVTEVSMESWRNTFAVNLDSVFYLSRYAIPVLQESGGGAIVINSSIAAFKSFPNHPAYCAAKAGLNALCRQMALDYSPSIRVNAICPGPVDTPMIWESAIAFPDPEVAVTAAGANTPMQRLGLPQDIASLVRFLASEESAWMTGATIPIDGGAIIR